MEVSSSIQPLIPYESQRARSEVSSWTAGLSSPSSEASAPRSLTPIIDSILLIAFSSMPVSLSISLIFSSGTLSILSMITQVSVNSSPSIPRSPRTCSSTFLLLTLTTMSSSLRPRDLSRWTMTESSSASALMSLMPQMSTFHW